MSNNLLNFWIDSHVHIYPMYDIDTMLDCAYDNFQKASEQTTDTINKYVLFITQGINEHALQRLADHDGHRWNIQRNNHEFSAQLNDQQITLIPGQQLVSSEGIELLVIGGSELDFSPKRSIYELIDLFKDDLTILPWGFGKWLGKRGALVTELLQNQQMSEFMFVGDIPGRLNLLGGKTNFNTSNNTQLRGVDPLPFENEQKRIASFGSCLQTTEPLNIHLSFTQNIANYLKSMNEDTSDVKISHYGNHLPLITNLCSQLKIRLKK